jgi:hypothetical protein
MAAIRHYCLNGDCGPVVLRVVFCAGTVFLDQKIGTAHLDSHLLVGSAGAKRNCREG